MVVCNSEETEKDQEELVQILLKVLHTSEKSEQCKLDVDIKVIHDIIVGDCMSSNSVIIQLLPLVSGALGVVELPSHL